MEKRSYKSIDERVDRDTLTRLETEINLVQRGYDDITNKLQNCKREQKKSVILHNSS